MHFIKSIAISASALATFVAAQSSVIQFTSFPSSVTVGKPVTLDYKTTGTGPITILLRRGAQNNLQTVETITTSATGSSFTWTPESTLSNGSDYALEILQNGETNYGTQFSVTGGSSSSISTMSGVYMTSTMSTATRAGSTNCVVTQIKDGQPQAATGACSGSSAAATPMTPIYTPKMSASAASNSSTTAPIPAPYSPMPGATGSPAPMSNSSTPTYSVPANPTQGSSGSGANSVAGSGSTANPTGGAAQLGSSFALIAGAVAAFAFLN